MMSLLRWLRDAWVIAGITLVLVLLLDGVLKAVLPEQSGWPTVVPGAAMPDRAAADALKGGAVGPDYFAELRRARHMRWEPYVYWRRQAVNGAAITIDDLGRRATWQPPETEGELWVFGGSTVWGTGARDDHTLPSELARALAAGGRPLRVVNYGESGYVSTQGLITLVRQLQAGRRPAAVLFYDGVNDVFAALQSGQPGWPQNEWERQADFGATNGLDNYLAAFPRTLEGVGRLLAASSPPETPSAAAGVVAAYAANVRAVRALAAEFGFQAWFAWQPSIFTRTWRSPSETAVVEASLAAHRDLQLAANAALEAMGGPLGVFDLSGLLDAVPEPLYLDFCHLSEAGNRRVAEALAARILAPTDQTAPQ